MTGTPPARRYDAEASILLIGMRGTGLSTLAFMAARALKFRVVDSDQVFLRSTGLSRISYTSTHGAIEYRRRELELLQSMLSQNQQRCIIVCSLGAVQGTGQGYVAQYGEEHPVIHIVRDAKSVQSYLKNRDIETVGELIRRTDPIYRRLSSFEFYNTTDSSSNLGDTNGRAHHQSQTLTLKQLEADFLQFVKSVTFQRSNPCGTQDRAFSHVLERRQFTYALPILLSTWNDVGSRFSAIDVLADTLELIVAEHDTTQHGKELDDQAATRISQQYYQVKRQSRLPVIFHAARYSPELDYRGGTGLIPGRNYISLLHHGLRLCPEYICVDLALDEAEILRLVASKGSTNVIGDLHVTEPGRDGWNQRYRRELVAKAQRLGCDLVRITQDATTMDDNFAVRQFAYQVRSDDDIQIPLIAYNTGRLGRTSHFLNPTFSPVTDSALLTTPYYGSNRERLLTVCEAQSALYSSLILDSLRFGIYGSSVAHSYSPSMHNAAFKFCGMPHGYSVHQHTTLEPLRELVHQENFGGMSISAPFKQDVQRFVDSTSPEAQAIGAINTILPMRSNSTDCRALQNRGGSVEGLYGDNTDWAGIHTCVQRNLSPINAIRSETTALVLGAGGMARAAVFALIRLGIRTIFVHNRTESNAVELARHFHGKSFPGDCCHGADLSVSGEDEGTVVRILPSRREPWPANTTAPTIIVSCITVQEADDKPPVDFTLPQSWLNSTTGGVAIELAYTPIQTPFLEQIRGLADHGWIACDGLQVLPEQGVKQFELFTGRKAPVKLMRDIVRRALHDTQTEVEIPIRLPS